MNRHHNPATQLALALHRKLADTSDRFCQVHNRTDIKTVREAASIFLASLIAANAGSRDEAIRMLEEEVASLQERIVAAPESLFRTRN